MSQVDLKPTSDNGEFGDAEEFALFAANFHVQYEDIPLFANMEFIMDSDDDETERLLDV